MQRLMSVFAHRWTRAVPALLTIALLAPVPVLASINWVSGWNEVAFLATNVTTKPSFATKDISQGSVVQMDMGSAAGIGLRAGAVIELSRQLQITGEQQSITVNNIYQALLQNAKLSVKVWFDPVIPGHGANTKTFSFTRSSGNAVNTVNQTNAQSARVFVLKTGGAQNNGNYVLHIRVTYQTQGRQGKTDQWANPNPASASSHTFTITG
jgi:hypothetical protein